MGRALQSDDRAASPLASFLVAMGLFSLSFSTILVFVAQVGGEDADRNLLHASEATGLAGLLTDSAGTPSNWNAAPPQRLGLLKPGTSSTIDLAKLSAMRSWTSASDYDAARTAAGLSARDIYVRTYPVYYGNAAANLGGVGAYRLGYVGDYTNSVEQGASSTESASLDALPIAFQNTLVDRQGLLGGGDKFEDTHKDATRHAALRLAGLAWTVDMDTLSANDGWWKVVNVGAYGGAGYLSPGGTHALTTSKWTGTKYAYGAFANGFSVAEDQVSIGTIDLTSYTTPGSTISLKFHHWASGWRTFATVNPAVDDYGYVSVKCVAQCRAGDEIAAMRGGYHWSNNSRTAFGETTVDLTRYAGEKVDVSFVWHSVNPLTAGEGWFLRQVKVQATPTGGATKVLYDNSFDYTDSLYDGLVIGSKADHSALDDTASTGGIFTRAVADWVSAGGDLFVFGSDAAANGWLPAGYSTGSALTVTGPANLAASDLSHPILNTPYRIRPGDLDAASKSLAAGPSMLSIVQAPVSGGGNSPLLSITKPGLAGLGSAVVTSYMPYNLSSEQRSNFLVNMLLYGKYSAVYTEYGPPAGFPFGTSASSSSRNVLVDATSLGLGVIEVELVAFVW